MKRQYKKFMKRRLREQKREGSRLKVRGLNTASSSAAPSQATSEDEGEEMVRTLHFGLNNRLSWLQMIV